MSRTAIMVRKSDDDVSIQTQGRWIEKEKVKMIAMGQSGVRVEQMRRVYFDGHDLYIVFKGSRYYLCEFEIVEYKEGDAEDENI